MTYYLMEMKYEGMQTIGIEANSKSEAREKAIKREFADNGMDCDFEITKLISIGPAIETT